ncbi:MAG: hypothetical protein HKN44_13870 [Ilumatobacter sp.]|nr:hypothetical protein [Ilumatobacter sp.]
MINAEIYKLRTQLHPIGYATVLLVGVLVPSAVLIWYTPTDSSTYTEAFRATFGIISVLLAIEFGGWLLGTEYRQGTVKRMLTSEPRRLRALATKGGVGAAGLAAVLVTGATVGWVAARVVGSMNDVTVPWQGWELLGDGLTALVAATFAYGLSAITRSDSFAKVGTVALILVIEPMLGAIPHVGDYTIGSALNGITTWIASEQAMPGTLAVSTAFVTLAAWLGAVTVTGATLFARRDV